MGTVSKSDKSTKSKCSSSSFSLPSAVPPLPAPTLSPVKSARREQLLLLIISSLRRALLSKGLSLRLLSAHSWMMLLPVKPTLTCGSQTWPAASTTTLSLREMSAADLDSARRLPSSPHVTGLAKSVLMFLPEPLHTWLMKPPLPRELSTSREIAFVARMDTLTTVMTLSPPLFLLPCQFLPRSLLNRLSSFAQKFSESARLMNRFRQNKYKILNM